MARQQRSARKAKASRQILSANQREFIKTMAYDMGWTSARDSAGSGQSHALGWIMGVSFASVQFGRSVQMAQLCVDRFFAGQADAKAKGAEEKAAVVSA